MTVQAFNIQTASKLLNKIGKIEINIDDLFRTSWIIYNVEPVRPNPTVTLFYSIFLKNYRRWRCEILAQSSFKSSICSIKIWHQYLWQFGNYVLFGNVAFLVIFCRFFIMTFNWNRNFEFWWFHRKDLVHIYQNIQNFEYKNIFFI